MLLRFILIPVVIIAAANAFALGRPPMILVFSSLLALTFSLSVALKQDKPRKNELVRRRALIIGAGTVAVDLAANLEASGTYCVAGFVEDPSRCEEAIKVGGDRLLGSYEETTALVVKYAIDEVFVASAPTWQQLLVEKLATDNPEVALRVVPSYYESMMQIKDVEHLGDIAVVRLHANQGRLMGMSKRIFDVVLSAIGLVLLLPVIVLVYCLIKLTSQGPAVFKQERIGRYGKPFWIYKFRTMRQDAEADTGPVLSEGASDGRLTKVGRWLRMFRLDEIPQLWNVLRDEMSIVGPRPERTCFVREFEQTIPAYSRRHQVRPGITGLAQICGGYHTGASDKLRFDLIYITHQSVWYDLAILLRTVLVVVLPTTKGGGGSVASRQSAKVDPCFVNHL